MRRGLSERREFKLDRELAVLLRDAAAREDRSESAIIRRALRTYLEAKP